MACIPSPVRTANSTEPYEDGAWPNGDRPSGGQGQWTINGTGFGSRVAITPTYEDFEGEAVGPIDGSPINDLLWRNGSGHSIIGTDTLSGTRTLRHVFQTLGAADQPGLYTELSGTQRHFYHSCHIRVTGEWGTTCKFARCGANSQGVPGNGVYQGYPRSQMEAQPGVDATVIESITSVMWNSNGQLVATGGINEATGDPTVAWAQGVDLFYEHEFYTGTDDNLDGFCVERVNGIELTRYSNKGVLVTPTSQLPTWFLSPMNVVDNPVSIVMDMDSVYFDETREYVVMTDTPTLAAATKYATQPIVSWVDSNIVVDKKRQSFGIGETAYLQAVSKGVIVSEGNQVTVTADDV